MDPAAPTIGYKVQPISNVDVVLATHEHGDHNYIGLATGSPTVLRGLKDNDWAKIDQTGKDLKISSVATYHDSEKGAKRGKNTVFVVEVDGLRVAHLGDLGHLLEKDQVTALSGVDVLIVPVGGFYTVDAETATKVAEQVNPRVVVPMHFKTDKLSADWPGGPLDQHEASGTRKRTICYHDANFGTRTSAPSTPFG